MELINDIEVQASIEDVWAAFNDVERIAPCLPGAQLQEIEGEEFRGIVKVKVGPITTKYQGQATFLESDRANWKVVIKGDGRDSRGAGNARALITATLDPVTDTVTRVNVTTDLTITGKVAQFGRGAIVEVSSKLMGQFAENLETLIEGGVDPAEDAAPATDASAEPTIRKIDAPEAEAVDILGVAGNSVLKRLALPVGILLVLFLLRRTLRR